MTNLISCIQALMASHKLSPSDVSRAVEMSPSMLSRVLSGERSPSHETIKLFMSCIAKTPGELREIVRAHMLDELERLGAAGLVSVSIGDNGSNPDNEHLVSSLMQAIASFDEARDLAQMIVDLSSRQSKRARAAVVERKANTITYPKPEPLGHVAEDGPKKKKPR